METVTAFTLLLAVFASAHGISLNVSPQHRSEPPTCSHPLSPKNGRYHCGDFLPIGYLKTTVCDYICNKDFTLVGKNYTTCQKNENTGRLEFSGPVPKCVPTPIDLVIAIGSSCSLGRRWKKMLNFLLQFISRLEIHRHKINVATFLYNVYPDKKTALYFKSIPSANKKLLKCWISQFYCKGRVIDVRKMRVLSEFVEKKEVKKTRSRLKQADQVRKHLQLLDFEPNQTYTERAIRFARKQLLGSKSRKNAKKVVLLITDGVSDDPEVLGEEVDFISEKKISLLVIGIGAKNRFNDNAGLRPLLSEYPEHHFYLKRAGQLTPDFARSLARKI